MNKLYSLIAVLLLASSAYAQVPPRSTPMTCVRDDALSTVPQAEGQQTPCRIDANGNLWVSLGTQLNAGNDSITVYGSDDGGTTKRLLKTDSAGNVSVLMAPGSLASGTVTTAMTGTTSTSLIGATASNYIYVTSCSFSNDHASVDTTMLLQDGSGGTAIWKGMVPHGGGSNVTFPVPLKVPTAGNALYVQNVTTGSSTYASCSGFKSTVSH